MRYVMLVVVALFFVGCGGGKSKSPPPSDPAFDKIKPIVDANCGGCHNDKGQRSFNAGNFKTSKASARIKNGSMPPPPRVLDEKDKTALLAYLDG